MGRALMRNKLSNCELYGRGREYSRTDVCSFAIAITDDVSTKVERLVPLSNCGCGIVGNQQLASPKTISRHIIHR